MSELNRAKLGRMIGDLCLEIRNLNESDLLWMQQQLNILSRIALEKRGWILKESHDNEANPEAKKIISQSMLIGA